jgi:hypothetical protein
VYNVGAFVTRAYRVYIVEAPTMGRQQITEHIEAELSGRSTEGTEPQEVTDVLCQHCGIGIETEGQRPDDYVVHSVPSHGGSGQSFVFYCGPTCFQDAMDELLDV